MQVVEQACMQASRQSVDGVPPVRILEDLARAGEAVTGSATAASILLIDAEGLLRNGASPSLPAHYVAAIDGIRPRPGLGTCSAAAATGELVVTPNFLDDGKWTELGHLPLAIGFIGACAVPIKSAEGTVLGTFGIYFRDVRQPSQAERLALERLADAAAQVLAQARGPLAGSAHELATARVDCVPDESA